MKLSKLKCLMQFYIPKEQVRKFLSLHKQHEMLCKACVRMNDFDIRNYTFKQVELIEPVNSINVVDINNFKNTTFKFEVAYQLLYKGKPIDK